MPNRPSLTSWARQRRLRNQWFAPLALMLVGLCLAACGGPTPTSSAQSISAGPLGTAEAYLTRGDEYASRRDFEHAIADYSQAIQLKPNYAEAYNNRGLAYALSSKVEMPNAIADYSQAIRLRPDYAYAYNNRGVAYMASGHPDEAMADFDRAIELEPNFPQAHSNRANALYRQGHIVQALIDFAQAEPIFLGLVALVLAIGVLGAILTYRTILRWRLSKSG